MPKKQNEMGLENTIVTILTEHISPQPIPISLPLHDPNDVVCVTPTSSCYAKIVTCHVIPILMESTQTICHAMPCHKHVNIGCSSH
jgi:hypothetical protein